ncbi:MAG: glycosyltransferase family 39 protein [Leptospira sp.]|nr:glycosyltransferase family 39 protein [Leptospira sp.]
MNLLQRIPRFHVLVFLVFLILFLGNQGPLYDQDEAAYAGFARTMIESGDFILQSFPFSEPHRKPPLHIWLTAFSFSTFGISEFSMRLFPLLWIFLTCILTYMISTLLFDKRVGKFSFIILATSLYFPLNGKIALVDGLLTFLETLGFYALVHLLKRPSSNVVSYVLLFWFSIALGALTKGPPIFIFLGGICFVFLWFQETRKVIFQLKPWFFLPVALLPLLYWGYLAWERTNGEMIRWMYEWYVLRRATDPVFGQSGPPGSYTILFFVTLFPWSIFLPFVTKDIWSKLKVWKSEKDYDFLVLISALLFGWIFYEFMQSKLPSYPLASYPILSILIANEAIKAKRLTFTKWLVIFAFLQVILINLFLTPYLNEKRSDTKRIAQLWKSKITQDSKIIALKNYAIPSLAFYLERKIDVKKDMLEWKSIPAGSLVLVDKESYLLFSAIGMKSKVYLEEEEIWLYDRNKSIRLLIVSIL